MMAVSLTRYCSKLFITQLCLLAATHSVSSTVDIQCAKQENSDQLVSCSKPGEDRCSSTENKYVEEKSAMITLPSIVPSVQGKLTNGKALAWLWPTPFLLVGEKKDAFGAVPAGLLALAAGVEELAMAALPKGCEEEQRCSCPSCESHVIGGWQHSYTAGNCPQTIQLLVNLARKKADELLQHACAKRKGCSKHVVAADVKLNVDFYGASHRPHVTSDSHMSAVFCASIGESDVDSNFIHFSDPRPQAAPFELPGFLQGTIPVHWEMQPGKMIIFPAFVQRYILANADERPRVFVTIDLRLFEGDNGDAEDSLSDDDDVEVKMEWPTPVQRFHDENIAPSLNDELGRLVLGLEEREESVTKSNKGGWQSAANLFERQGNPLCQLRWRVYYAVSHYLQSIALLDTEKDRCHLSIDVDASWASVNRHLHSNAPHIHPGAHVSGVYYIDVGGDSKTAVHHIDPRPSAISLTSVVQLKNSSRVFSFKAFPGVFVLFPGWLEHYVEPHMATEARISVSFNSRVKQQHQSFGPAWHQLQEFSEESLPCKIWVPARHKNHCSQL